MTRCHPGALLERDIWSESLEESKDQNYYSEAKKNVVKKVRKEYDAPMILSIMSKLVGGGGSVIVVWNDIFVFKNILFEVNHENYKKNFLTVYVPEILKNFSTLKSKIGSFVSFYM